MAGTFGTTVTQRLMDYITGKANAFSGTATPYVTLSSTSVNAACSGLLEPVTGTNYGGYARQPFTSTASAASGSVANTSAVTFPTPSGFGGFDAKFYVIYLSGSSGTDAPTATTMIATGTLTQELICNIGVPVVGAIGAFTLSLSQVISGMTTAGANLLLDALTGKVSFAANFPAATYLSLYTTLPTISQTANTNEAGYTSYARTATAGDLAAATAATPSVSATNAQINFPTSTGGSSTVVGWGLGPASSGATALYLAGATTSQAVSTGNQPFVATSVSLASLQ